MELEAAVSTEDIVEQMAFEQLEPSGPLHLEFMLGQICATVANVNRDPDKKREPWVASDFAPALAAHIHANRPANEAVFIDDPEAMSALIKSSVFGAK